MKPTQFKIRKSLIFLSVIILLCFSNLNAASIKNLTIENGLSNRRVFGAVSDKKGFVWFATKTHIDRFDGEKFDYYKLSDNEKNRGIVTDDQKNVYAFTERSIYLYSDKKDFFEKFFSLDDSRDEMFQASINTVITSKNGEIYAGTNKGLLIFRDKRWIDLPLLKNIPVHSMTFYKNILIIGTHQGLYAINNTMPDFLPVYFKFPSFVKNLRIQALNYDKKTDKLWIGTFANGVILMDLKNPEQTQKVFQTTVPVKKITDITPHEIWIASDGEGIHVFDRYNFKYLRSISQTESGNDNIGANGIYDIMNDNNNVWISTYTGGVYMLNTKTIVDRIFRYDKNNRNSLVDDHVNTVLEDSDGDIWFGTNKGISLFRRSSNSWSHFLTNIQQGENAVVLSLYEDKQKNIWVGGYATRLVKINKRSGSITPVNNLPDVNPGGKSYIYDFEEDEMGNLWMGGSVDKLKKYDIHTGKFTSYNVEGIVRIYNQDVNTLLLATYRGVYRLNKLTGKNDVIDLRTLKGGERLPGFPFINNIISDRLSEDKILIGTEGFGLFRLDLKKQEISVINTKSGLSSDYIYGLLYDNLNRLWISTEYGLDCLEENTGIINSYFKFDGLSDNTFNFMSFVRLRDGRLILGTPKGANLISPDKIKNPKEEPFNLRMKGFYLFYEQVRALTEDSPLKESIDETREISLSYQQHSFSVDFINLNFANQERTLYSWKLDGFNDDWSQPSREHKAVYTNIPSGKYTFKVKAVSIDTRQESEVRSFVIHKYPPFWASVYAYILYTLLVIWLVYFLIKFWLNKIDSKFTQDKIKFFISMAHEIRTPLTLIKAPLNEIDNENLTNDGRSALELARKNTDKLFGMVTQLLDFQKLESDAMSLFVEETLLNVFVDNILNNFNYLAKSKQIKLIKNTNADSNTKVWIDRDKVQIMIENLLTNAIKYSNTSGIVTVLIEIKDKNDLLIQISDTGIGIPKNAQTNLFNTFYRAKNAASSLEIGTGIGLMFTKKLVELHKGIITFMSVENSGSTFRIEIPVLKENYSEDEIVTRKHEEAEAETHEEENTQHMMHILLVEDNDELRSYLAKILRKKYNIEEAVNGIEALKILENDSPDLILTDILMPEMDGYELCKAVKSNISTCHIPLILLTSLSERDDVLKGLNLGADDYITKPFDMTILESKIKTIFNNRALFRKKYIEKSVTLNESNLLNDLNKNFMKKLVDLIEENITNEEFNIDELASEMAMSRSVFFKKIKSLTGQNPKDFIRDIKMNKAADLLRDQKYSVSEIAYLIGFPNAKYFSTAFKKYYGISPTSFIEKEKRDENYIGEHDDTDD